MRDLVSAGDLAHIKSQYPDKAIRMPSLHQQQMILMHLRGVGNGSISKAIGDSSPQQVKRFLSTASAQAIIDHLRATEFSDIRASREYLTSLLFESYHKAGSSMEEIAAIREIGKLNGLYESDKQKGGVTINQTGNIQNVNQFTKLSEEELLEIVQASPSEAPPLPAYAPAVELPDEESLCVKDGQG